MPRSFRRHRMVNTGSALIFGTSTYEAIYFEGGTQKCLFPNSPRRRESPVHGLRSTRFRLWQFKRMPFELTKAPATFQRLIDSLFGPEMEPHVFGYLDDIIIATDTFEEYQKWLEIVLTKIRDAQLTVNWKKSEFRCSRVRYLLPRVPIERV